MRAYKEAERTALIEYASRAIKQAEENRDEIPFGLSEEEEMEISLFELALAALTAEPVAQFYKSEHGNVFNTLNDWNPTEGANHLYPAPPVAAPVVPDFSECPLCDSNFISGMQSGYRFGAEHDRSGFNATVEHYRKEGRHGGEELKRLNANQIKSREGE